VLNSVLCINIVEKEVPQTSSTKVPKLKKLTTVKPGKYVINHAPYSRYLQENLVATIEDQHRPECCENGQDTYVPDNYHGNVSYL